MILTFVIEANIGSISQLVSIGKLFLLTMTPVKFSDPLKLYPVRIDRMKSEYNGPQ